MRRKWGLHIGVTMKGYRGRVKKIMELNEMQKGRQIFSYTRNISQCLDYLQDWFRWQAGGKQIQT